MKKVGIITRLLIFLRILKKKSKLDAWMDREERGFPFSDIIGLKVQCLDNTFTITAEMEQTSRQDQGMSRGLIFHWWVVKCPFCQKHDFRVGSALDVETMD